MRLSWALVGVLLVSGAAPASVEPEQSWALETVFPRLPGKNNVRWWEFDWKWTEFTPVERGAPVRLHFYEEEREVARTARPFIEQAYADLTEQFGYVPTQTIPFLLYNSHFEFQSTRAFFVSETVLGVTSTRELTMALPYWGEHQRFEHVMRHEMVHQFTIQKLIDEGRERGGCNPLQFMPLWFIEGLAERFSQEALTPEVRAVMADALLAREGEEPEGLPDFFAPGVGFEGVYLLGHARVRYLDEVHGEGTSRRILEESPRLCPAGRRGFGLGFGLGPTEELFPGLVASVVGVRREVIDEQWKAWAREQVRPALDARHPYAALELIEDLGVGDIDSFALSPDGRVLFYRTVDMTTGVAQLYLRDLEDPGSRVLVTKDQRIGLISLHAFDRRVTAIGDGLLAYIGRVGDSDVLFVRTYRRESDGGRVRLRLGAVVSHRLADFDGIIEGGHPAISPNGAIAFIGLKRRQGFLDVYRMERPLEREPRLVRLTDDPYAEQGLVYGADGTLYYASDATPDGRYELFRLAPGEQPMALTRFEGRVNATSPARANGRGLLFETEGDTGFIQAHRYEPEGVTRLTEVPTSFRGPAVTAEGALLGLVRVDGRNRLARLPRERWLSVPVEPVRTPPPDTEGMRLRAWDVPRAHFDEVEDYSPLATLRFVDAIGAASTGPFVLGQALFSDLLKNHLLSIQLLVFGDLNRINGDAFYINTSGRTVYGLGLIARTGLQLERDFAETGRSFLLQRFGGAAMLEYPFGRYIRVEGALSPQVLRSLDFVDPLRSFAVRHRGSYPALQGGGRFALDTLRLAPIGPYDGVGLLVTAEATTPFGGPETFGMATSELLLYKNLLPGHTRLFAYGRIGLGTTFGGTFRENFFLPAAFNLRALRGTTVEQVGQHYYLGQFELNFPLAPRLFDFLYLQGLAGMDLGRVAFDLSDTLRPPRAAAVLGANFILGPLALRLHFARPFAIGGETPPFQGWITHFTIGTPFLFGFQDSLLGRVSNPLGPLGR
jgi:hypothetical protein